ncbi:cysteine--tRNA ligase [Mangrovicella endophytica]|uniref:cysteine--tRNA ligase n=1 Tax=Mangrovicella endophytica TaxID=2066697 RepID=UPI000C9E0062|nr:cysteine--tRNA ligase [Mangrovicella endophytica]
MDDGFRGVTLTNTMTRRKERFLPLDWRGGAAEADRQVRMYVCGPTVYDFAHIGNARPVIVFDVLFRLLRHLYGADRVTYVRNITDVDDKINARAARDHPGLPLNEAIARVTEGTAAQFHRDVAALGALEPTVEPRATAFVTSRGDGKPDMVAMIGTLIQRGHAYVAAGEVLFDVTSMPDYGALSHRRLDEQQAGARVAVEAHKRNAADFVLWKLSDADEPGWDSPWGRGRPGWHIECSVMSAAYLGNTFDIHGGGLDLIFPHHENEIAQSRCAHGTASMAEVWMHNGFVQVEGRKMSKSEGNFVTIHDLLETEAFGGRRWPGEVLRLAMLMTHYREPIDFSIRRLEEAERTLTRWAGELTGEVAPASIPEPVLKAVSDDLATPLAIAAIHAADGAAERVAALSLLGIDLVAYAGRMTAAAEAKADSVDVEARIAERLERLQARDFAAADRIRAELLEAGIQLKDGKDPATGERVTTWELKA